LPVAATVAIAMVAEMVLLITSKNFHLADGATAGAIAGVSAAGANAAAAAVGASNSKELGRVLYTDYLLPFELAAVILLVAIVAAIALTLRPRKEAKSQIVGDQVRVKAGDRLKIIKMDAEKEIPSESAPAPTPPAA
jgi:NADH-quinone oxidoreductase subunit J